MTPATGPLNEHDRLRLEPEAVTFDEVRRLLEACLSAVEGVASGTEETAGQLARAGGLKIGNLLTEIGFSRTERRGYGHSFYVATSEAGGPIKVGISSDVQKRRKDLERASGRRLHLAAVFPPTSYELEQATLARFGKHRTCGEWLRRSPEVEAFVEACRVVSPAGVGP